MRWLVDSSRLRWKNTFAWWLTGSNDGFEAKTANLRMHLTFANGQQVIVGTTGLFGIHKPTVSWEPTYYRGGVMHGYSGSLGLAVGVGTKFYNGLDNDLLNWGASSSSLVDGTFAMVQLLTQDTAPQSFSDWRLDNGIPYNNSQIYGNLGQAFNTDADGPSTPFGGYITDNFKQYFVYRPDLTSGSIWVTLGIANWHCHGKIKADTSTPEGWSWVDTPIFYHSQSITPSTELPEWRNRKTNF